MKLGSTTPLAAKLFGCALICISAACGSRTSLLQDDAGTATDSVSQQPTGGRASGGSSAGRAGRGAAGTAAGAAGRTAEGGRAARPPRGGQGNEDPRAGRGGDDEADGGQDTDPGPGNEPEQPIDAGQPQGGSGGEGGQGGEGAAGEGAAGSEGAAGEGAAGSGGEPAPEQPVLRMNNLTPEQVTTLCGRIDAGVMSLPWDDGINGYCSRRGLTQPETCTTVRDECNARDVIPVCADNIPVCPNITVDEFVQCRIDTLAQFVSFYSTFSCDSQPPLADWQPVQSCAGPHERCPPMVPLTL